ncbi:histidinol dehydrogenase [Candidatus Daviesbacteria bacterium]|nr:histidinol dehydrogenase [Candidatus Daviesbacteria bacterium]
MKVVNLNDLKPKDLNRLLKRASDNYQLVYPVVKKIISDVKSRGDKAILDYEKQFGAQIKSLKVTENEIEKAFANTDPKLITALKQSIKNITAVAKSQLKSNEKPVQTEKGIAVWREWRPIEKVGLYIPGGRAVYPSSLLMTAIPAQIAGCPEIVVVTPPNSDGEINQPILVAAKLLGIKNIFKTGGAQAIGALAFGTTTISKVYKIFGAGNLYVTAAKQLVFGEVNIDMPAGPSEVFVIADQTANPKFIAADLIADCEHGEDSAGVLITTSKKIAEETAKEIETQLKSIPTSERVRKSLKKNGLIAVTKSIDEAIDFTNEYAPEHLEIMTKNPKSVAAKIINAGSVFLGDYTCKGSGDYATGANHVLPTGQNAKSFSALSVDSFGKMIEIQEVTKEGLTEIRETIEKFSAVEGLPGHGYSATIRFEE